MNPDTAPDHPAAPQISVAVIGLAGGVATAQCRAVLDGQAGGGGTVITIPQTGATGDTVPARRLLALHRTDRALLALIEDTTRPDPGWLAAVVAGFADPQVGAVWGPVRIDPDLGARFRALGRMEYGRFDGHNPAVSGPPGNCMAFRRAALIAALPTEDTETRAGITEHQVAARMQAQGWTILFLPKAGASYAAADVHGASLSTRFGHGRLYAATSPARHSPGGRAIGAAKALLVPGVLTLRALRHAASPPRLLLAEAPWIMLMALAWGLGELTGHLFGIGHSERTWR